MAAADDETDCVSQAGGRRGRAVQNILQFSLALYGGGQLGEDERSRAVSELNKIRIFWQITPARG